MYNFIVIIMIIIAVLLVLAVLVQRSKGGGFNDLLAKYDMDKLKASSDDARAPK